MITSIPKPNRDMVIRDFTFLLLLVLTLSGCGEVGEAFMYGTQGLSVPQARAMRAQTELMQIELQQRQRQHLAEDNLLHFYSVVVPKLNPFSPTISKENGKLIKLINHPLKIFLKR